MVVWAGLVLGPARGAAVAAPAAGTPGDPPAEVIASVEHGVSFSSFKAVRVHPVLDTAAPTALRAFQTNPAAIAAHVLWASNFHRLIVRDRQSGMAEESLMEAGAEGPPTVLRFGWSPHLVWKQLGGETPWLVPLREPGIDRDPYCQAIVQLVGVNRRTVEQLSEHLGLPQLLDRRMRYSPGDRVFHARSPAGEISVRSEWDGARQCLRLRYEAGRHGISYLAELLYRGPEGARELVKVVVYNSPEPDARYLVESFDFAEVDREILGLEAVMNPMAALQWADWLEYADGEWIRRRPDGRVTQLPGFSRPVSFLATHRWVRAGCVVFAGVATLILARGIHHRMRGPNVDL